MTGSPPLIKVRELRGPGTARMPNSIKEWKRYRRQLVTDLRRIDRQEESLLRRAQAQVRHARQRQRLLKQEAGKKRREFTRELRRTLVNLARYGNTT